MSVLTQAQVRAERSKFESWACAQGMSAGRNEAGYYDDDCRAANAWRGWIAHARLVAERHQSGRCDGS